MKKLVLLLIVFIGMLLPTVAQGIRIKNNVFEVFYSQELEQPLWIKYRNVNRPTKVNRGAMDFYKEPNIKTSDADDYKANIYDKGHGAPAAAFSDNMENLKQTFSYLNCLMQDQYLNRGEWRMLEEQERKWDDTESLTVLIVSIFDKNPKRVPTGAAVPNVLQKHIYFETQKKWKCYVFLNEKPKFHWDELEMVCDPKDHITN
jgi:endonuclease G